MYIEVIFVCVFEIRIITEVSSLLPFVPRVQALILSPTRELAAQTEKVIMAVGLHMNIQAHACIGGKSVGEDIRKLEYGVHVVSGTPGRVCDMIKRRTLRTRQIKLLVLVCNYNYVFARFLLLLFHSVKMLNNYPVEFG